LNELAKVNQHSEGGKKNKQTNKTNKQTNINKQTIKQTNNQTKQTNINKHKQS